MKQLTKKEIEEIVELENEWEMLSDRIAEIKNRIREIDYNRIL